jgi:hypothetical protein
VTQADVQQFVAVMQRTDIDWQLVQLGNTVHSFTDRSADSEGARYDERSAARAFARFGELLQEVWGD